MSAPEPMPSVRRRAIPGMTSQREAPAPSPASDPAAQPIDADASVNSTPAVDQQTVVLTTTQRPCLRLRSGFVPTRRADGRGGR